MQMRTVRHIAALSSLLLLGLSESTRASSPVGDEPDDSGGPAINKSEILEGVLNGKASFQKCYRELQESDPGFSGRLYVRWRIDRAGWVVNPEVEDPALAKTRFGRCMLSAVKMLRFPPRRSTADAIRFPFVVGRQTVPRDDDAGMLFSFDAATTAAPRPRLAAAIMPLLIERKGELIECDRRAMQEAPGEKGRLTLRWEVDSEGHARNVSVVEPEKQHTKFAVCAIALISGLRYPAGSPIAPVELPIVFGPRPPNKPGEDILEYSSH